MVGAMKLIPLAVLYGFGAHSALLHRPGVKPLPVTDVLRPRESVIPFPEEEPKTEEGESIGPIIQSNNACSTLESLSANSDTINLSSFPDLRPATFALIFRYTTTSLDLGKFDVWQGLLLNIVRLAQNHWELDIPRQTDFPPSHNCQLKVLGSLTPPRFQTKSLLWTLQETFETFVRNGRYSSASMQTVIDHKTLGFATIRSTLASPQMEKEEDAGSVAISSSQVNRPRALELRLQYVPNGATISDAAVFRTVISMLILSANGDPKTQSPRNGIALYNRHEDFTIRVSPIDEDQKYLMPLIMIIHVLGLLPTTMLAERSGGRWAELKGQVRNGGTNIGRVEIQKGEHVRGCVDLGNATATA
ncbi:MAG: hypothetical protein Q9219_001289 [cf. Caloplaca sp. 3 TL-2023]